MSGAALQPVKQMAFTWLLAIGTCACFVLTVLYAFDTKLFDRSSSTSLSAGNVILIIRVLSGVASFLMSALVVSCFDRVRWMLVARKKGADMLDFLTLAQGTGALAWLAVMFAKGGHMIGTRMWAFTRIIVLVVVNILGIIILSDVSTETYFVTHNPFPVSAGIGAFTPSFATDTGVSLVTAIYVATDFNGYLTDTSLAYPMTPVDPRTKTCGLRDFSDENCATSYFAAGGTGLVSPWPWFNNEEDKLPVYTIFKQSGYQFDFSTADSSIEYASSDCVPYGTNSSSIFICLKTTDSMTLNAKFLFCLTGDCLNYANAFGKDLKIFPGPRISLKAYRRSATVHYSRANESMLAVTDLSSPSQVLINPSDLFLAYNSTFKPVGTATTGIQFRDFISNWLQFLSQSSRGLPTAIGPLRNLLVLPLIYFQPTYLNPSLNASQDAPAAGLPDEMYTTASLTDIGNRLVVGRWSTITYTILGGVLLAACLMVLVCGSLHVTAGGAPAVSPWPVLDLALVDSEDRSGKQSPVEKADVEKHGVAVNEVERGGSSGLVDDLRTYQTEKDGPGLVRRMDRLRVFVKA